MGKNKSGRLWILTIAIILVALCMMLSIQGFTQGVNGNTQQKGEKTYNSLDDLYKNTSLDLEIPEYVSSRDDLEISSVMGQIVEIHCSYLVLKAASFVNNNADPLGLYEKSTLDSMYRVENEENIKFFRYRVGYKEYPHCTIINWCTENTAYGLMIEDDIKEVEALDIIGISQDNLVKTTYEENNGEYSLNENENSTEESNIEMQIYKVNDQLQLDIPKFENFPNVILNDGRAIFYIDNEFLFAICYSEQYTETEADEIENIVDIKEGLQFRYAKQNPFSTGTVAYNDYKLFMTTLNDIIESIVYQE